jgi:hypothetical protein
VSLIKQWGQRWSNKLLARRSLCIGLGVDHFCLALRHGRQWQLADAIQMPVDNPDQQWQVVLGALSSCLQQAGPQYQGVPLRITLASRWCPMQSVPWSDALFNPKQATQFLQNQFVALFGEAARDWVIQADDAPYGQPRMACAIERDLLTALHSLAEQSGSHLQSVESSLSLAWRNGMAQANSKGRCQAMALVEPGRISLALLHNNRLQALLAHACGSAWERDLAAHWMRWGLRQNELQQISRVVVFNLSSQTAPTLSAPFEVIALPNSALGPRLALLHCDGGA